MKHVGTGMTVEQQNTHWYKSKFSLGWTANPLHALPGETDRVGFHDCVAMQCKQTHSCSLDWYWLIENAFLEEAERDKKNRPKKPPVDRPRAYGKTRDGGRVVTRFLCRI